MTFLKYPSKYLMKFSYFPFLKSRNLSINLSVWTLLPSASSGASGPWSVSEILKKIIIINHIH